MEVEIFTLCDAATDSGGKLNLLGSFDTLIGGKEPMTHPACAVAVKIRFSRIEEGNHAIKITFADTDGKPVLPSFEGSMHVKIQEGCPTATTNFILNMQNLKIEHFGDHSIDLAIDGRHEASIPLYVREAQKREEQAKPK
jgi:hypothetical protein